MGGGERERAAVWSAAALHIRDWIQRCCQSDAIGKGSIWTSLEIFLLIEGKFECLSFSFLLLLLRRRLRCPPSVIHLLPCRREALGQRSQGGRTEGESPPLHSPSILRPCQPAKLLLARTGIHPPPPPQGERGRRDTKTCVYIFMPLAKCQKEDGGGRERLAAYIWPSFMASFALLATQRTHTLYHIPYALDSCEKADGQRICQKFSAWV